MKRVLFVPIIALVLCAFIVSSYCVSLTKNKTIYTMSSYNNRESKDIVVKPFAVLELFGGVQVRLVRGDENRVEIIEDRENLLFVAQKEDVLRVGKKIEYNNKRFRYKGAKISLVIYYTEDIYSFHVSSAASIISEDLFTAPKIECVVSSSGQLELRLQTNEATLLASSAGEVDLEVNAKYLDVEAASSSEVSLKGRVSTFKVLASSAAEVKAKDLEIETATVSASSASECKLTSLNAIDVKASSAATVKIYGELTEAKTSASSGGEIILYGKQPPVFVSKSSSGGEVRVKE